MRRAGGRAPARVLQGHVGGPPRPEECRAPGRHGADVEPDLQRDDLPRDRRSLHAGDRHPAGALSVRGHSVVFDDVRTRRPDHGAGNVVARSRDRPWRVEAPRRLSGDGRRRGRRTRSRERSCTKCAAANWRRSAKFRSASITAASIRRRCSCCLPACMPSAPATTRRLAELWPAIEAALRWIDGPGDPDRDGFIEYHRTTEHGLANQGWKDSQDAIFHADGRLAEGPIALAEVQGYVYAAKCLIARGATAARPRTAWRRRSKAEARDLAERFETAFWCPELGTYALALDGAKNACRVRTSNAGQLLFTGIAARDRAGIVIDGLLRPPFFSGWGIRTVASGERRFNPMSYHNGSIWPHDNALIALGFARYGRKPAIETVFTGLFEAATYMDLRRLPELFCGFQRRRGRGPTLYPVACSPQAWASATPFLLLHASLGLEFDPSRREIRLRDPRLPSFLDWVKLQESPARRCQRRSGDPPSPATMCRSRSCAPKASFTSRSSTAARIAGPAIRRRCGRGRIAEQSCADDRPHARRGTRLNAPSRRCSGSIGAPEEIRIPDRQIL